MDQKLMIRKSGWVGRKHTHTCMSHHDTMTYIERRLQPFRFDFTVPTSNPVANSNFPVLDSFHNAIKKADQLINAVTTNPTTDVVYFFPTVYKKMGILDPATGQTLSYPPEFAEAKWDWCIAGSYAVSQVSHIFIRQLDYLTGNPTYGEPRANEVEQLTGFKRNLMPAMTYLHFIRANLDKLGLSPEVQTKVRGLLVDELPEKIHGSFTPTDLDMFFLNSPIPNRMVLPGVDLVHTKAKSVEELLLNFDLPCCRAAFNSKNDYWISAQCLYALFTGKYPLPAYVKDEAVFTTLLTKHRNGDPMKLSEKHLFTRMQERITKYEKRGFNPTWISTDTVLPWIQNRFHYGEWKC
jgi:hypothetical protein